MVALSSMKSFVLLVALLLVILVGLPLVGGMAMLDCPNCYLSWGLAGMCLAVLATFLLLLPQASMRLTRWADLFRPLLLRLPLERPPRAA